MKKFLLTILIFFCIVTNATAISTLDKAKHYQTLLDSIILQYWSTTPNPEIIYGEVEQESSWNAKATLKTSRELGRGLGQITIAYDKNGNERFNNFKNGLDPLKSWDWKNDPYNERYQLTYLVLQLKSNYNTIRPHMINNDEAIRSTLVSYNAGYGRWLSRRKYAVIQKHDKTKWNNGLDISYGSNELTLLYDRPLWKAVNEYPIVIFKKSEKYKSLLNK